MLLPRIIPTLLIRNKGLVKTVAFKDQKYVGDPINAVRILNEKEVDELMIVDIDATAEGRDPDYQLIENLAAECRMPLCYGGGVQSSHQIEKIIALGVEKVALSSAAIEHPNVLSEAANSVGNQSVVAVLDVRKRTRDGQYEVYTHNGTKPTGRSPVDLARELEAFGAGEIVLNSIDNDGKMAGYDMDIIGIVRRSVNVPLTCLGGAGSLKDMEHLFRQHGVIGAAAGSLFVFKGIYRAVLINYPDRATKDAVFAAALGS